MYKITLTVMATLILAACGQSGGSGSGSPTAPTPHPPVISPGTPVAPVPTPSPSPTPVPPPVAYTCTNHPLTGRTLNSSNYSIQLKSDCTYVFTDSTHVSYGSWTPDSNPSNVTVSGGATQYPLTLTPSGAYVCLPANGPQTCQNYGYAGSVYIVLDNSNNSVTIVNR